IIEDDAASLRTAVRLKSRDQVLAPRVNEQAACLKQDFDLVEPVDNLVAGPAVEDARPENALVFAIRGRADTGPGACGRIQPHHIEAIPSQLAGALLDLGGRRCAEFAKAVMIAEDDDPPPILVKLPHLEEHSPGVLARAAIDCE